MAYERQFIKYAIYMNRIHKKNQKISFLRMLMRSLMRCIISHFVKML